MNFAALSSGTVTDHATKVAAIVAAIAPNCTLRSYPSTAEEDLISLGVNIINCSYCKINSDKTAFNPGQYCNYDAGIDDRVKNDYVTYVIAAGNDGRGFPVFSEVSKHEKVRLPVDVPDLHGLSA